MNECTKMIPDGQRFVTSHQCDKTVEPGTKFCKFHNTIRRRQAKAHKKWEQDYDAQDKLRVKVEAQASRLSKALGEEITPHYHNGRTFRDSGYTGKMIVSYDLLKRVADFDY